MNANPALCSNCGAKIQPFGIGGHLFVYDALGPICLDCAQRTIPGRVAEAKAMDELLNDRKKD